MTTAVKYFEKIAQKDEYEPRDKNEAMTKLIYGKIGMRGQRDAEKGKNNIGKETSVGAGTGAAIGAGVSGLFNLVKRRKLDKKLLKGMGKGGAIVGGAAAGLTALNYSGGRAEVKRKELAKKELEKRK